MSMKLGASHIRTGGFSILEANIAVALTMISLAGCFAANANFLAVLKSAHQSATARQSLQEGVDQMPSANSRQTTDPDYPKTTPLTPPTHPARTRPACTETLTVTAYPPPAS